MNFKKISRIILVFIAAQTVVTAQAQINSAKVYWVGHSLMSHTYSHSFTAVNLIKLMDTMATSQSKSYDYYQHTTPGAPIGWNWAKDATSWASSGPLIQPLISTTHADYGTYDVMVLTEAIDITNAYYWWSSSFYARKFYNAAKNANADTRLYLYESWHHYNAGDDDLRFLYGPMSTFDWKDYMLTVRSTWDSIIVRASDPALTQSASDYTYQGTGADPGDGSDILDINIIPTGRVLVEVLDRLDSNLSSDDWSYKGGNLKDIDFFENPLANYPSDTITKVHPADALDDIHPSNVLAYLNSLVHYAVIYKDNPKDMGASNGVPQNIADIFKEVVWRVVTNDPRTGIYIRHTSIDEVNSLANRISLYPNPAENSLAIDFGSRLHDATVVVYNTVGKEVLCIKNVSENILKINTANLANGMYTIRVILPDVSSGNSIRFLKQ